MSLFDTIVNTVGGALGRNGSGPNQGSGLGGLLQRGGPAASGGIVGELLGGLGGGQGGMATMLETLAANGLGQQVSSWMTNNPNMPVSPQQIHDALGSQQVQELAQKTGLPVGDSLRHLADHLPAAASQASGTAQP